MKFFQFIFSLFSVLYILSGCNASVEKAKPSLNDSSKIIAPEVGYISPEDFVRYHNGVKEFFEKKLLKRGFNGGILVAKEGRVIFEEYAGYANLKTKDTLTKNSAFHLASVSKTFTAMAVLKLVEMNKLSLSDSLQKFFPEFPYKNVSVRKH